MMAIAWTWKQPVNPTLLNRYWWLVRMAERAAGRPKTTAPLPTTTTTTTTTTARSTAP